MCFVGWHTLLKVIFHVCMFICELKKLFETILKHGKDHSLFFKVMLIRGAELN